MGCFRQHERIVANLARFVDLLLLCPDRGEGELGKAPTASMAAGHSGCFLEEPDRLVRLAEVPVAPHRVAGHLSSVEAMDPRGLIGQVGSVDGSFRSQERLGRGMFVAGKRVSVGL